MQVAGLVNSNKSKKNLSWDKAASDSSISSAKASLIQNGIDAEVVNSQEEAKSRIMELIPEGASVMTMSSETLEQTGISQEINESGKYDSVKKKLSAMNNETQGIEMRTLGTVPEFAVGSVHAVTENGEIMIASNTGSQLPAYAYGAGKVIWVVGSQKIVKNLDEGFRRIHEYVLVLESKRVQKAYGMPHSNVSKLLIINKEINQGRIKMIIVKEPLGF